MPGRPAQPDIHRAVRRLQLSPVSPFQAIESHLPGRQLGTCNVQGLCGHHGDLVDQQIPAIGHLVSVAGIMSERRLAPILANMNPERARTITIMLAEQKKLPELPFVE